MGGDGEPLLGYHYYQLCGPLWSQGEWLSTVSCLVALCLKSKMLFFLCNVLNNLNQKAFNTYLLCFHFFCSSTGPLARTLHSWATSGGCLISDIAIGRGFRRLLGPALCDQAGTVDIIALVLQGKQLRTREVKGLLKSPRIINSGGTTRTPFPATGAVFFPPHHTTSPRAATANWYWMLTIQ